MSRKFFSYILCTVSASLFCAAVSANTHTKQSYILKLCDTPGYYCLSVSPGETWKNLFPDARKREMIKRLNRTNLPLQYKEKIVIPKHLHYINHLDLSPMPSFINSTGKRELMVMLHLHAFGAYNAQGTLVHWGPISGGKGWCKKENIDCTTATGTYKIYRKQGEECTSSQFPIETNGGAPMPYCMHYYRGFALHASVLPGFHNSHGCIRVFQNDAEWLSKHFMKIGSTIRVLP